MAQRKITPLVVSFKGGPGFISSFPTEHQHFFFGTPLPFRTSYKKAVVFGGLTSFPRMCLAGSGEKERLSSAKGVNVFGCGSKNRHQNGTLVSGNMDQNLRNHACLILSYCNHHETKS